MYIGPLRPRNVRIAVFVLLHAFEIRQTPLQAPARIAEAFPVIVFERIAADPDHAVDRARAAERAASWPEEAAAATFSSGSVWKRQIARSPVRMCAMPAGIRIHIQRSSSPASSRSTR